YIRLEFGIAIMKPPKPLLYNRSIMAIWQATLESTGYRYWPAEMQRKTGLSRPIVKWGYDKLYSAGFVRKESEYFPSNVDHPNHPPRNLYEATDAGIAATRLTPLSSISLSSI